MVDVTGVESNPILTRSFKSAADYRAAITNVGVVISADHEITRAGADEEAIGVMVNKPNTGEAAEVIVIGIAKMKVGNTITFGQMVKCDSLGEAIPITTNKDWTIGKALKGGLDGDIIDVLLLQGHSGV